jgi:anthranilate synthase component 1
VLAPVQLTPIVLTGESLSEQEIFDGVTGPFTKDSFLNSVRKTKQFIREGQAFQIVLSQRFSVGVKKPAIDIYRYLQATNPSPYAYFLKCPDFVYLGSSPETFVRCTQGHALLRAIAGTRPRGKNEEEDVQLAKELKANEKEMAEHRMLVDLGRNDLGRVSKPGTVHIGEIACLTKYTHVMHLFTEVMGQLDAGKTSFDVFQSCFPAGTVSGAPKVRAMQLLFELEPEQRGVYSGSVGYFDLAGNMDGAIAIRSALIKDGFAHVNAGGGIVFDSDPETEYNETRNKAKSILQAIKLAQKEA